MFDPVSKKRFRGLEYINFSLTEYNRNVLSVDYATRFSHLYHSGLLPSS